MSFGAKFRFLREAKGLPRAGIDELFQLTPGTVSNWENGYREPEEEMGPFDGLDDEKETLPVLYRVCGEDGEKSALILDYTFDPDLSEVSFKTKEFSLFVLAYPAMPELTVTPELAELNRKLEPSAGLNSVSDTNYGDLRYS